MNVAPRFSRHSEKYARPVSKPASKPNPLATLLQIEGEMRKVPNERALHFFICAEIIKLVPCHEAISLVPNWNGSRWRAAAATGVMQPDNHAPGLVALGKSVSAWVAKSAQDQGLSSSHIFDEADDSPQSLSQRHVTLLRVYGAGDGAPLIGVVALLGNAELDRDLSPLLERVAGAFGHALSLFVQQKARARRSVFKRRTGVIAAAALMAMMAIPVPMSALAPVEVVAASPFVVTAPFDGVIDEIVVDANAPVRAGDLLVQFNDTELRSALIIAESEASVADARERQVIQGAAQSEDIRRELAIVRAERDLARTELEEAQRRLALTQLTAQVDGIAVFASRESWQGRPVATGERILEIADPSDLELRIEVALGDTIVLDEDAYVRVFPDHDPFQAFSARIVSAAYRAETVGEGRLAYVTKAQFADVDGVRLGQRGTARISHGRVALGYYLLRRPIAGLRQWTGL